MSARRKKGSPMKYRGFYCGDKLWEEMQKRAEKLDISDSDFIRQAIEEKIERGIEEKYRGKTREEIIDIYLSEHGTNAAVENYNRQHKQNDIQEGDKFINKCTGEEYTAVKVRQEDDVIIGKNAKEKRAFADNMTYNKSDLKKVKPEQTVRSFPKGGGK